MAKTMEIFKTAAVFLLLVPRIDSTSMEELKTENGQLKQELAQLKRIVDALQAQMGTKVDVADFAAKQNDTEELEARVTLLEVSMEEVQEDVTVLQTGLVTLADEVDDVESANLLQDDRINTLEAEIFDNENDIEELVSITTGLTNEVSSLDQRVEDLESGGGSGGGGNVTELEVRVETLEEVTSQLTDDVSSLEDNDVTQDERIASIEEDVTSLDQRVEDLESGGDGGNVTDYSDTIFMAVLSSDQTSSRDPLIFDADVINPGGHYNPETGKYTAPYDGIYQFSVHLAAYSLSFGLYFNLEIDDSTDNTHVDHWNADDIYRGTTILIELSAGQTVHVAAYEGTSGDEPVFRSYFNGYLVSPN